MSDIPNLDERLRAATIDLANEYNRLNRQIESKTQQLDSLLAPNGRAGQFPIDFEGQENRRYNIDFVFEAGDITSVQEKGVVIESGTIFRCAYVECFVRGIGTAEDRFSGEDVTVQATLPWDQRLSLFDFLWRLRDTGTDREWVNRPQPSLFLGGAYTGPLWLPRRVVLGGGTEVLAEIAPFVSLSDTTSFAGFFFGGTVQSYEVHVNFVGHEVPDRSAP